MDGGHCGRLIMIGSAFSYLRKKWDEVTSGLLKARFFIRVSNGRDLYFI